MFTYAELMAEPLLHKYGAQPALLPGYRRSFNHCSTLLRGTEQHPCPSLADRGWRVLGARVPATLVRPQDHAPQAQAHREQ